MIVYFMVFNGSDEKLMFVFVICLFVMCWFDVFILIVNSKFDVFCVVLGIIKLNNCDFECYW